MTTTIKTIKTVYSLVTINQHVVTKQNFYHDVHLREVNHQFSHPNIINYMSHDDRVITMEPATMDLSKLISIGVPESRLANYISQIAAGIVFLNNNQICHRDLRPQNILYYQSIIICDCRSAEFHRGFYSNSRNSSKNSSGAPT